VSEKSESGNETCRYPVFLGLNIVGLFQNEANIGAQTVLAVEFNFLG
jgi:hypothetical protein